jgi:hypothetical protein
MDHLAENSTEDPRVLRFAQQLISDNRGELSRADLKASQAMAAAGVVAMVLITAMTSNTWSPRGGTASAWLWWTGCALWVVAVGALVLAFMPRLGAQDAGAGAVRLAYFGDVCRYRRGGDVRAALVAAARQPLDTVVCEVRWTAGAVMRKYRMIQIGVVALAVATLLFAASGLR